MRNTDTTPEAKLVGIRIGETRKAQRLSVKALAKRVGCTSAFIRKVENGASQPSFEIIIALAKALNVSAMTFFDFDTQRPNARKLRQQIRLLLPKCRGQQLQQTFAAINSILGISR